MPVETVSHAFTFAECAHRNQRKHRSELAPQYDYRVCGSGMPTGQSSQQTSVRHGWRLAARTTYPPS
jgi:hypothetical protein